MRRTELSYQPLPLYTVSLCSFVQLDRNSGIPLYRQICQGLREAILSGKLADGTRLPTERALAKELGVNRTTVMNAYNELASEGLIEGHVGRGTLVKRSYQEEEEDYLEQDSNQDTPSWLFALAPGEEAAIGPDARLLSEITSLGERKEVISFAAGSPASECIPTSIIQSLVGERLSSAATSALTYCPVEGLQSLRRAIAERMRRKGVAVDLQNILILSGSTQGIGLIGRFLLNPGDEVIVETPTYLGAIQTFRALGARVIGIPTDNEGMRVDLLEALLARRNPRLIYTLPTFQNPTGTVLSLERRKRLLHLARRYQIPILEDDPYSDLYFEGTAPQPLKALDTRGHVMYLSTFSKTLAPGLRVAWLAAPELLIERLSLHKQIFDLNTTSFGQWIVAEMIQRGLLDQHLQGLRGYYRQKRDLMLQTIEHSWPAEVRITPPGGGFHLWCRLPGDIKARVLLREVAQDRVAFVIGEPFHVDGGGQHSLRMSFASPDPSYIVEGIQSIGNAIQRVLERRGQREEHDISRVEHLPMV